MASESAQVFIKYKDQEGWQTHPVEEKVSLGNADVCEIRVPDHVPDALHCSLIKFDGGLRLRNVSAEKEIFLNGRAVRSANVRPGDHLRVGGRDFFIQLEQPCPLKESFVPTSRNVLWQRSLDRIPLLASSDFPVMIFGPSGSGKDMVARQIHGQSRRQAKEFISVNCAAIHEGLVESELFGHKKGSFTGATEDRPGAFELADGGTLFLDEVGDLSPAVQAKLLRCLENNEIKPVGSDHVRKVNVRVLAATHKNLLDMADCGLFRSDLLYRLNVIRFDVPSLKDRNEDVPQLVNHFGKKFNVMFTEEALLDLQRYSWPGNVRELRNVVARAASMYPGQVVGCHFLPSLLDTQTFSFQDPVRPGQHLKAREYLRQIEHSLIVERLKMNAGNQRKTASDLGIPKSTLHDILVRLGIRAMDFKPKKDG